MRMEDDFEHRFIYNIKLCIIIITLPGQGSLQLSEEISFLQEFIYMCILSCTLLTFIIH